MIFMKKLESKALEFIYQDVQIHFLLSQGDNVMVNATDMAKAFNKRIEDFKRLDGTKLFIKQLIDAENLKFAHADMREQNQFLVEEKDVIYSTNKSTFMHRILAIKFAAWLDTEFEIWIYSTIDKILFGHYKQHWDAHIKQEDAKERMEKAKNKLLLEATQEDAIAYFEAEKEYKIAKNEKLKAIQSQYKLFENI